MYHLASLLGKVKARAEAILAQKGAIVLDAPVQLLTDIMLCTSVLQMQHQQLAKNTQHEPHKAYLEEPRNSR